jgi:hypothetical protein
VISSRRYFTTGSRQSLLREEFRSEDIRSVLLLGSIEKQVFWRFRPDFIYISPVHRLGINLWISGIISG